MSKHRKFKTVAGYLRSMEQDLWCQQGVAEARGTAGISDDDGHRQIVNNLLRQIGVAGSIGQAESPRDGVKRLRATAARADHIRALDTCAKWLARPGVKVTFVGARAEYAGTTYRGKHYTQEETAALEKIQREHGVSLDQAIAMREQTAKAF